MHMLNKRSQRQGKYNNEMQFPITGDGALKAQTRARAHRSTLHDRARARARTETTYVDVVSQRKQFGARSL